MNYTAIHAFSLILASSICLVRADPPIGYYDLATNKTGLDLQAALHAIVRNHHVIPYDSDSRLDTSDALAVLDQNPVDTNYVIEIYNGSNSLVSTFGQVTGWNREHLWPNSYGLDDVEPAYSDLHNLRACDANVNSSRGNKYYDTTLTNSVGYSFPAHIEAPLCSTDSNSWEPPFFDRGNIARAMFYMALRYTGDATNEPNLRLTDRTELIQSSNAYMGRLSTLLRWSAEDPVDLTERSRNDFVYTYQTNRNPFVDHPEWVALAFGPKLTITLTNSDVLLEWPSYFVDAALEVADNSLGTWEFVTDKAPILNGFWRVTLPVTNAFRFYRIKVN